MKNIIKNGVVLALALACSDATFAAGEAMGKAAVPVPESAVVQTAPKAQAAAQPSAPRKHAKTKKARSKSLDLRHCLELQDNAAIAKCAGE